MAQKKVNVSAKAREAGMDPRVVHQRLKNGWSLDRALSTPVRKVVRRKPATVAPKPLTGGTSFGATPPKLTVTKKKPSSATPPKLTVTTEKPSSAFGDDSLRVAQLEDQLDQAKRRCKLAQIAALSVIVAVVAWAVNP